MFISSWLDQVQTRLSSPRRTRQRRHKTRRWSQNAAHQRDLRTNEFSTRIEALEDRALLSSFPVSFVGATLPTGGVTISTDTAGMSDDLEAFFQSGTGSVTVTGEIDVLDQTLNGSFTFTADTSSVVSITATGVSTAFDGASGDLLLMDDGSGAFVITDTGFAGELDVTFSDNVPGLDLSGTGSLSLNSASVAINETVTIGGSPVTVDEPAGPFSKLSGDTVIHAENFVDIEANFSFEDRGSSIAGAASGATVFQGTQFGESNATGVQLTATNVGLLLKDAGYALATSGAAEFVGLNGLNIDTTFDVGANTTGSDVNTTIATPGGDVTIQLPAEDPDTEAAPMFFTGTGTISVTGAFTMSGDIALTKILAGLVLVDVTDMEISLLAGNVEAFKFNGLLRFGMDHDRGFQLLDTSFDDVHLLGVDVLGNASSVNSLTFPTDTLGPANLTTIFGAVDVAVLNHRRYIDVTFTSDTGAEIDPDSITDNGQEFFFSGSAWEDADFYTTVQLSGNTYRYFLLDKNSGNDSIKDFSKGDLFRANENFSSTQLTFNFIAGSWEDVDGNPCYPSTTEMEVVDGTTLVSRINVEVRSGITTTTSDVELGPLVLKSPYFNIEELQLRPPEAGNAASQWSLVSSVALGVDSASLKFGNAKNAQSQDDQKVKTEINNLLGTFSIDSVISPSGDAKSSPGKFLISVGSAKFTVLDQQATTDQQGTEDPEDKFLFQAEASGVFISYNPLIDSNFDGTISEAEQAAFDKQEMLRVDDAVVSIPKFGLTGQVHQYTRPAEAIDPRTGGNIGGTTVPGLSVRRDGFHLGEASLTRAGKWQFGKDKNAGADAKGMVELEDLTGGLQDIDVSFNPSFRVDIDGGFFVAAKEAVLFPGKKFEMKLTDSSDSDSEAVRVALKFTDNAPTGFSIKVDKGDLKFGKALSVHTENFIVDTSATGINPVVGFDALSATVAAGPLALSGEIRNFGLLRDGSIQTRAGFGVFFGAESLDSKKLKWPEWLPIRPTEVGIQWRNLNANPADFRLIVSADVTGIKGLPLKVSGTVKGLEFDVGALLRGENPLTGLQSMGVTVSGDLFGGEVTGGLIGGVIPISSSGNEVPATDFVTPIVDHVFFVGLMGGFKVAKKGGFTIRMALTDNGPLGVQLTGETGEAGILLEPISGLKLTGFSGGVEFFKSLNDANKPEDLLDPNFDPALSNSSVIDAGQWESQVRSQTLAQYKKIKEGGQDGDFLAAFRSPILISGGAQIQFHTPADVLKANAEVRISIDPNVNADFSPKGLPKVKVLLTGDLILFGGLQRCPARIFGDLSKLESGQAKLLLMAQDIPTGPSPLFPLLPTSSELKGTLTMRFLGADGQQVDFFDETTTSATPTAKLVDPVENGSIALGRFQQNRYLDLQFSPTSATSESEDAPSLSIDSITDVNGELELLLPDGTRVPLAGAAVHPDGAADNVYRFTLPAQLTIKPGTYQIRVLEETFTDSTGALNAEQMFSFDVTVPQIEPAGPADGARVDRDAINRGKKLAVRFLPTAGAALDTETITDAPAELVLSGAAAADVVLGQPVRDEQDDRLYYYDFTGNFGIGTVTVQLPEGTFSDTAGNSNPASQFSFTVTGPEITLRSPANGTSIRLSDLNQLGYLEVYIAPSGDAAIDEGSLTDAAAEFVLAGAGAGVTVSGVAVPVLDEPNVYRYSITGSFTQAGDVQVDFLEGSFQDVNGLPSANKTESFLIRGVEAALVDPKLFTITGLTLLNQRGYLDVQFTPTAGATLDESSITDAAAEFRLEGDAATNVVVSGAPTSLGNGVYRYTFDGQFEQGEVGVTFLAGTVADSAGFTTTELSGSFLAEVPAAGLLNPLKEQRADRSKLNDNGYIDIQFEDRTGKGLNVASITDAEDEFTLLVKNDAGEWVAPRAAINGAALQLDDTTFRYFFSDFFNPGVVRVLFTAGTFKDIDGALNLAAEQQFAVVNNAPSFEFQIEGSYLQRHGFKDGLFGDLSNPKQVADLLKMFGAADSAELQDIIAKVDAATSIVEKLITEPIFKLDGFLRMGAELLVEGSETVGARTTLDLSGTIGVYLLGNVGAAAGRLVVQADQSGLNIWGIFELQAKLDVLRKAGIDLQAFGTLQFNTSGEDQTETITLRNFNSDGSDLTQTYVIPETSLMVAAAGKMLFHVPTFDDANPFGQELFRISAVASLSISADGLQMFAKGDLEIGPPDVRLLDIDALGVFVIGDKGFAGDVSVDVKAGDIAAIKDYFEFGVSARILFNVTGEDQEVKILDRFLPFLTEDFIARLDDCTNDAGEAVGETFSNSATKCYTIGAAPPPRPNSPQAPIGPYVVISAVGDLIIADVFRMHGDFYFEINSTPEMFVTVNASIALDPIAAAAISGTFHIDRNGAYGGLQIGASLDVGPLHLFGAAQFEFNTQEFNATIDRYVFDFNAERVTDQRETVLLTPGTFHIIVAGVASITDSFKFKGHFELENTPQAIVVTASMTFNAFDALKLNAQGSFNIVKGPNPGLVMNVGATLEAGFLGIDGIFDMDTSFQLLVNTRGGSGVDAFDLGVSRGLYRIAVSGELTLLSTLTLTGGGFIEVNRGVFRMQVSMSTNFFGLASLSASGYFSSEGEFDLSLSGGFTFGAPGFLGVAASGSLHVSLLDDNGTQPFGDGNKALNVSGGISGTFWVFGFTIGAGLGFNYSSGSGVLSVTASASINFFFFSINVSHTFNIGTLPYRTTTPLYVAGNADDTFGQKFRGGVLYLNSGPRTYLRNYDLGADGINEEFLIEDFGVDDQFGGHIVRVAGNGVKQTFRGVTGIVGDGGNGRDYFKTDAATSIPVTLSGGSQADRIEHLGSGPITITGGLGDDEILAGYGDNLVIFDEGDGNDVLQTLGGPVILDAKNVRSDLTGLLAAGSLNLGSNALKRTRLGTAFVTLPDDEDPTTGPQFANVGLLHDGESRLVVGHPGHPFKDGDRIEIVSTDVGFDVALQGSPTWEVTDVTSDTYSLRLNANQIGRGVGAKAIWQDANHNNVERQVTVLHDGVTTATVYDPNHLVKVGDRVVLDSEDSAAYTDEFFVTAVTENSYSFTLPFDSVRDKVGTNFDVETLYLGYGDDLLRATGSTDVDLTISDTSGGDDEIFINGGLPANVTLAAGGFSTSKLNLQFDGGVDRLTLFSPDTSLALGGTTSSIDLGATGLRVVADSIDLTKPMSAGHFAFESKETLNLDQPLNATHDGYIDARVFGDDADLLVNSTLSVSTGATHDGLGDGWIRLVAPDGAISGSKATTFDAPNSHLIYKAKDAPTGPLQTHVESLTFAYGPLGAVGDVSIVEQDDLTLTSLDHFDSPFEPNAVFGDETFAGINWTTTATTSWLDQVRDGNDLYAVVVPDGNLSIELLAEDSWLLLEAGQIITQGAGKDITITADDITFRSGPSQVIGSGKLTITAQQDVWNYRIGTASETAGGSDLTREAFARSMDLSTRDLAALADGYSQITIGNKATGNTMVLGDASDAHVIKFTGQERDRDSRFRDPTKLLTDTLTVSGDVNATGKLEVEVAGTMIVDKPNLHVPNGGIDSGLTALELLIDVGSSLRVSGWLVAASVLEVVVNGEVTIDLGAFIETRDDNNTLSLDATGAMSISGRVEAKGAGGKPQLKTGGSFSLQEGGFLSAPGENAIVVIESSETVTLDEGTSISAGVQFVDSNGSLIPIVTGKNSNLTIRAPHEMLIPSAIAASQGITLEGGTARNDHSAYFQQLVPVDHPLHDRSSFAVLLTGSLVTFGDAADLVLSGTDDIIVRGNIDLRGKGSDLVLQSDRSVFVEGFVSLADGNVTIVGGMELDGTDRDGADATGSSVTVYGATRIEAQSAGNSVTIRGSHDVDILGAVIAGGDVGPTGVTWAAPGDGTITVTAGEQIFVDNALQASLSVTLTGGTPGTDDSNVSVLLTPASGINVAGLSGDDTATGLVTITAPADLEMMGTITAGATIVESPTGQTFDWVEHLHSDVQITAGGRAFIGGNTVNSEGQATTAGGVIRASRSIEIDGTTHSSGAAVEVHPNSELSTHNADGSIVITSPQDAVIRGRIASGGEIIDGVVTLFEGTAALTITATNQVVISREVGAAKTVTITGGTDPVDAGNPISGLSVAVAGTGLLRTSSKNSLVDVSGPGAITFFSPLDDSVYNVQAPGVDSAIHITSGGPLTMGGRLQSYRDIVLNNSTLPRFAASVDLTASSLLETINGSITLDIGGKGQVLGDLTAGGAGSDITILFTSDNLTITGDLKAADEITLDVAGVLDVSGDLTANRLTLSAGTSTVDGQTDLFIRETSQVSSVGADAVISLTAPNNIRIDGTVGLAHEMPSAEENLATVTIESLAGDISQSRSGRIESDAGLLIKARKLELLGTIKTSTAVADAGAFDVTFDASSTLKIEADVEVAGSLLAKAPVSIKIARGELEVSGSKLLRIESPIVVVGGTELVEGKQTELGGVVAAGGRVEIVASDVTLRAGTQVHATQDDGVIRIDADYLDVVGSIRAGADINADGAVEWSAAGADVDLNVVQLLTVGGQGYDASGVLVDVGGRILATGTIDITVNGGTEAIGVAMTHELSTLQSDATGFGAGLTAAAPSMISIVTDRGLQLGGSIVAHDDDADVVLTSSKLLKVDGFVQADDQLTATGGADESVLSVHVTGTLNTGAGGSISITGPKQILIEGSIGQLRAEGNDFVIDTGSITVTTPEMLDIRGQVLAQSSIDLDAAQLNVLNGGFIRASAADAQIDARATGNVLIATGGSVLSSGSIYLQGQHVQVDGFVDNDNASKTPRVILNAVESLVVTGGVTSKGDLELSAGIGADWTDEQRFGTLTSGDLTGGLVRVQGAGLAHAGRTLKITSGQDAELEADATSPTGKRSVQTPTIVFVPETIDVIVGYREIANGIVLTPVVKWVDTLAEVQTGVELVRSGTYFHTMDVTLTQDGYYNGTTKREYFIQGIDYANSLADVTYPVFGNKGANAATNLITDGQFKDGGFTTGVHAYKLGQRFGGWTVTRGTGELDLDPWRGPVAGGFSSDLNGDNPGAIAQSFATEVGKTYVVTFELSKNAQAIPFDGERGVRVSAAGQSEDFYATTATWKNPQDMDFRPYEFVFVATDTTTTLEFASLSLSGSGGAVLGNVAVTEMSQKWRGAPNNVGLAIPNTGNVTFNFSGTPITNETGGDFNVYQVASGNGAAFGNITVEVSADGINFVDITASAGDPLAVAGDESHDDAFARSYDLLAANLSAVKFIRITSIAAAGFELDAVGANLVNPHESPIIDWQEDAPAPGATFNQLSQAQREIVTTSLGYQPLYNFSFANGKEHRTQNGSTSVIDWQPYWATNATHVVQFDIPGLEDRYIRLPIDAELDVARSVTNAAPQTSTETVGTVSESGVVRYDQDRSRYTGFDDLDQSIERFAVSYAFGGTQTFSLSDGFGGSVVSTPSWALGGDFETGLDTNNKLISSPIGFLADTQVLSNQQLVNVRRDVRILSSAIHTMLNDLPDSLTVLQYVSGSFSWSGALENAFSRGGHLAAITSSVENEIARRMIPVLGSSPLPGLTQNAWIGLYDAVQEGRFMWTTGEAVTYANWFPGEPNDGAPADAVGMSQINGNWSDVPNAPLSGFPFYIDGYILERPAVETFFDNYFDWQSKAHNVQDTRLTLSFEWTGKQHDLFTEVPVFELQQATIPVIEQIETIGRVSQPITEQQTVLKPTRVLVASPATEFAVFSGDSLKSEGSIVIDAGRDVTLSGLVTAKSADGKVGSITIDAGRDFFMTGAKPDGASEEMQAAVAGMTAVEQITITTGGDFTLAESISITADDGNADDSKSNAIVLTTTGDAIIRGTLSTTNTKIGEITVNAGDEIELKGEIISGHVANVFAGTDGEGGITADIQGHIKTLGSEVHLRAGRNGGNITLSDLFIETAGPLELSAPAGSISNPGGFLSGGNIIANAKNGINLTFEAGSLDAVVTGKGGIQLMGYGPINLNRVQTSDGPISMQGTGDITVGNVQAGGNNPANIEPLGSATMNFTGTLKSSEPVTLRLEGDQTVSVDAPELHLLVISGDVVVNHVGSGPVTVYALVVDGALTVTTTNNLIVPEIVLLSQTAENSITLDAGGDVTIGTIDAGDYAATEEEAAALRVLRGLSDDDLFTSVAKVTVKAGGAILDDTPPEEDLDIIAGAVTLIAGKGINGLELAVNEVTQATTTTGSISLSDYNGIDELSLGVDVVSASATAGAIDITSAASLSVGTILAQQNVTLTAEDESFGTRGDAPSIRSTGGVINVTAADDVTLTGPIAASKSLTVRAGRTLLSAPTNFSATSNSTVSITAAENISLTGKITAKDAVTISSESGDINLSTRIEGVSGLLGQLKLDAFGQLNVADATFGSVTSRFELLAGGDLITGLDAPQWIVAGADGELHVSAGGDVKLRVTSVVQADHIELSAGTLLLIATPRGTTNAAPKSLSLSATNYVHLHEDIVAGDLTLSGGHIAITREGQLRLDEENLLAGEIDDPAVVATFATQPAQLTMSHGHIGGGSLFEHGTLIVPDSVTSDGVIEFSGGTLISGGSIDGALTVSDGGSLIVGTEGTIDDLATGSLTLKDGAKLVVDFSQTTRDIVHVTGSIIIGPNVTLDVSKLGTFSANAGDRFLLVSNDGTDPVIGRFSGLPIDDFLGTGMKASIITTGGDGNDIELVFDIFPPVAVITPNSGATNANPIIFTFQFDEPVFEFTVDEIFVRNGTKGVFTQIDDDTYTLAVVPRADGRVFVTLADQRVRDAAGNRNAITSAVTVSDRTPPQVVLTPNGGITNADPIVFTFQFNEPVYGFDANDISVRNGTKGRFTAIDADTYTLEVRPSADRKVFATAIAGGAHDLAGNGNVISSGQTLSDRTPPTLIVTPNSGATKDNSVLFTFQFSEVVTGFDASDVSVTNGSKGTFTAIDGDTYTLVVIPTADGSVTVSVATGKAQDAATNGNVAGSGSIRSDRTAPAPSITPNAISTKANPIIFTFQFAENVTGFETSDITVSNGTKGTFTAIDGDTYTLAVVPTLEGPVGVSIAANSFQDDVGNKNAAASAAATWDHTVPTMTITPNTGATNANVILFTFQFSEPVIGFRTTDVLLSNGTAGLFTAIDRDTYTLEVAPTADGPVTARVNANKSQDLAGNGNVAAVATVTSDRTRPTLNVTPTFEHSSSSTLTFTFQFSETVSGFIKSDIEVTNGKAGTFTAIDGDTYTLAVTPTADGVVSVTVASAAARDAAGNGNRVGATTLISDRTAPKVVVGQPSRPKTQVNAVSFPITFSDTNFDKSTLTLNDIVLNSTGTATGTISLDASTGATRVVTIDNISGEGTLGISLRAGTARDKAGNLVASAGPSATFEVVRGITVTRDALGNIVIDDTKTASLNDTLTVTTDNANRAFVIHEPNALVSSNIPGALQIDEHTISIGYPRLFGESLIINTNGGDDSIVVKGSGSGLALSKTLQINGGDGRDSVTLDGSLVARWAGPVVIDGGTGDDALSAAAIVGTGSFNVTLVGGAGNDVLIGGAGRDVLRGGAGNDSLTGNAGNDSLLGQGGDDVLTGGLGHDSLDGGAGSDRLIETGDVNFVLTNVSLFGVGTDAVASIESAQLVGGSGANRLDAAAFSGSVTLDGGDGNDTLIGGSAIDALFGRAGADSLNGNGGADLLDGGLGADDITHDLLDNVLQDVSDFLHLL